MTSTNQKSIKVSHETHYHLKLFASYEGVSMAALLDSWVDEHKNFKSILTPEERQAVHDAMHNAWSDTEGATQ